MDWLNILAVQRQLSSSSSAFLSSAVWALSTMGSWGQSPGLCALQPQPTAHTSSSLLHTFNALPPPRTYAAFKSSHAAPTSPLSTVPLPLSLATLPGWCSCLRTFAHAALSMWKTVHLVLTRLVSACPSDVTSSNRPFF